MRAHMDTLVHVTLHIQTHLQMSLQQVRAHLKADTSKELDCVEAKNAYCDSCAPELFCSCFSLLTGTIAG
jgi:hypothetical protein